MWPNFCFRKTTGYEKTLKRKQKNYKQREQLEERFNNPGERWGSEPGQSRCENGVKNNHWGGKTEKSAVGGKWILNIKDDSDFQPGFCY